MYYSEFSRIRRIQRFLEKLAYISVGTDFLIAGATYLVIRNTPFSTSMLLISDYIDLFLVGIVGAMMFLLILMKSQDALTRKARMAALKWPISKVPMRYVKVFLTSI